MTKMLEQVERSLLGDLKQQLSALQRPLCGLEVFAREGSWITGHYAKMVDQMECWEINADYIPALRRNLPKATVRQVDSIAHAKECDQQFDFISIDNPQGTFGPYCEHFEILASAAALAKETAIIVFGINIHPYGARETTASDDYGMISHAQWFARREAFYGQPAQTLEFPFLDRFYSDFFARQGQDTKQISHYLLPSNVAGHPDYFSRTMVVLSRR